MKYLIASLAFLLCVTNATFCAQGQDVPVEPKAEIVLVAPSEAVVGELVRFDVSESTADSFQWVVVPDSVTDFEVYANGAKAVFSARVDGNYRFIVACAKGGTVDVVTHVVRVKGPPPMPEGDSLASWIPFWMWSYKLPRDEVEALAASFEAIAADVSNLQEPADWIKRTAEANREVLGDSLPLWTPILDRIGKVLGQRATEGALMTPEDHAKVWKEIAEGLRRS